MTKTAKANEIKKGLITKCPVCGFSPENRLELHHHMIKEKHKKAL